MTKKCKFPGLELERSNNTDLLLKKPLLLWCAQSLLPFVDCKYQFSNCAGNRLILSASF